MNVFMSCAVEQMIMPTTMNAAPSLASVRKVNARYSEEKSRTHEGNITSPEEIGHGSDEWTDARQSQQIGKNKPYPSISPTKVPIDVWRYLDNVR